MNKIKKFDEFINESVYDENDGFTSSTTEDPRLEKEREKDIAKRIKTNIVSILSEIKGEINRDKKMERGILICGKPGVGKDKLVLDTVSKYGTVDKDFVIIDDEYKNDSSLYAMLFRNNNKLIIFNNDSILQQESTINLLKYATDNFLHRRISAPNEKLHGVRYVPGNVPSFYDEDGVPTLPIRFNFDGYILIISNKTIEEFGESLNPIKMRFEIYNL